MAYAQRYCYAVRRDEEREGRRVALFQVMPELGPGLDRVERREIDLEVLEEALHKCHDVHTTVERTGLLGTLQDTERLVPVMDRQGHGMETYLDDIRRVALDAILGEKSPDLVVVVVLSTPHRVVSFQGPVGPRASVGRANGPKEHPMLALCIVGRQVQDIVTVELGRHPFPSPSRDQLGRLEETVNGEHGALAHRAHEPIKQLGHGLVDDTVIEVLAASGILVTDVEALELCWTREGVAERGPTLSDSAESEMASMRRFLWRGEGLWRLGVWGSETTMVESSMVKSPIWPEAWLPEPISKLSSGCWAGVAAWSGSAGGRG